jgi:prepilin-type N-terminal cleavage/methylation domain-containing protein
MLRKHHRDASAVVHLAQMANPPREMTTTLPPALVGSCNDGLSAAARSLLPENKVRGRDHGGFTLIDVMISLTVLAVLASLATQEFDRMLLRTRRTGAVVALHAVRTAQTIEEGRR